MFARQKRDAKLSLCYRNIFFNEFFATILKNNLRTPFFFNRNNLMVWVTKIAMRWLNKV